MLSQSLSQDAVVAPLLDGIDQSAETAELKGFARPVPFLRLRPN